MDTENLPQKSELTSTLTSETKSEFNIIKPWYKIRRNQVILGVGVSALLIVLLLIGVFLVTNVMNNRSSTDTTPEIRTEGERVEDELEDEVTATAATAFSEPIYYSIACNFYSFEDGRLTNLTPTIAGFEPISSDECFSTPQVIKPEFIEFRYNSATDNRTDIYINLVSLTSTVLTQVSIAEPESNSVVAFNNSTNVAYTYDARTGELAGITTSGSRSVLRDFSRRVFGRGGAHNDIVSIDLSPNKQTILINDTISVEDEGDAPESGVVYTYDLRTGNYTGRLGRYAVWLNNNEFIYLKTDTSHETFGQLVKVNVASDSETVLKDNTEDITEAYMYSGNYYYSYLVDGESSRDEDNLIITNRMNVSDGSISSISGNSFAGIIGMENRFNIYFEVGLCTPLEGPFEFSDESLDEYSCLPGGLTNIYSDKLVFRDGESTEVVLEFRPILL